MNEKKKLKPLTFKKKQQKVINHLIKLKCDCFFFVFDMYLVIRTLKFLHTQSLCPFNRKDKNFKCLL